MKPKKLTKRQLKQLTVYYVEHLIASHAEAGIVGLFFDGGKLNEQDIEVIEENMREMAAKLRQQINLEIVEATGAVY